MSPHPSTVTRSTRFCFNLPRSSGNLYEVAKSQPPRRSRVGIANGTGPVDHTTPIAKVLVAHLRALQTSDYYEVLAVPRYASGAELTDAHGALMARWDPTRFADEPTEVRELAARIRDTLDHAYEALRSVTDPQA